MVGNIFKWIGNMSSIVGFLAATFSFLVWLKLRKQNKRIRDLAKVQPEMSDFDEQISYHSKINTCSPHVFCICLLPEGTSIRADVENYLKSTENTKMPIIELNYPGLNQENLKDFIAALKIKRKEFDSIQATEIHIFLAGPLFAAMIIGAVLVNWIPVKLYNKNQSTRSWEYWCHLSKYY